MNARSLLKIFSAAFVFALPSSVWACAACFGKSDSALAQGMNWGIFTLLGVILSVLTCATVFFVHVIRKEAALNENPPPSPEKSSESK